MLPTQNRQKTYTTTSEIKNYGPMEHYILGKEEKEERYNLGDWIKFAQPIGDPNNIINISKEVDDILYNQK